jgi:hypothetical protein
VTDIKETSELQAITNVIVKKQDTRWGISHYILKNATNDRFYITTDIGFYIWKCLQQKLSFGELVENIHEIYRSIGIEEIRSFISELHANGLIVVDQTQEHLGQDKSSSFLSKRIISINPSKQLMLIHDKTRWIFSNKSRAVCYLFLLVSFLFLLPEIAITPQILNQFTLLNSQFLMFLFLVVSIVPITLIHEICHGVACIHYGVKPKEMGIGVFYVFPYAYCDTTEAWLLNKKQRMWVSASGPLSTFIIAFSLLLFSGIGALSTDVQLFAKLLGVSCFLMSLWSLCPFIEGDGYHILMDFLDIPNLLEAAKHHFLNIVRLRQKDASLLVNTRAVRATLSCFAILSVLWFTYFIYIGTQFALRVAQELFDLLLALSVGTISLIDLSRLVMLFVLLGGVIYVFLPRCKTLVAKLFSWLVPKNHREILLFD